MVIVYPSIDIQGGRVIRTSGADLESADELPGSPIEMARRWVAAGARWLPVVDVDGARAGTPRNLDDLRDIVALGSPGHAGQALVPGGDRACCR